MGLLDIGNPLLQIGAATNGADALSDYNLNLQKQQAMQLQNQQTRSALGALADAKNNGITNPQQLLSALAAVSPEYAEKAADMQAKNPLATMLQGGANNGGSPNSGGAVPLASLTGSDLLNALPPAIASQVKGYSEGRIQPSPMMMRTAQGQQLMQLVSQYDPTFDAVNYGARANTQKDFTSGKSAQNITALNTAMGHLSSLSDAYGSLDNSDYPSYNSVKNYVGNALGSGNIQTNTAKVGSDAHAVSEELAKVFRSTGMAESDVKAWEDKLSTSASPAQSKAVIGQAIELMNSRLDALGQQYNQGMGTTKNGIELLSPKAQAAYQKLSGTSAPETKVTGDLAADNTKQNASSITKEQALAELKRRGKIK